MGRIIYAEERLLDYLQTLGALDVYSVGLILGQSSAQKDFIIHLARTLPASETKVVEEPVIKPLESPPKNNTSKNILKSIQDIDVKLVADQAKHVTRMLPGGMCVLGIFVAGPGDCLNDTQCAQKLRACLTAIYKDLLLNTHLLGIGTKENLILTYNSNTKEFLCKSIETSTGGNFKPADWKFQKKATKWHHLEALVDLDQLFPIPDDVHPQTLKRLLKDIVKKISDMIESALIVIEGESGSPDDLIEVVEKKLRTKEETNEEENSKQILQVGVYVPCAVNSDEPVKLLSSGASMRLMGQLVSRVALHNKANIKEATNAIKQDILRSLASRFELHWDSVIEEENGSPEENIVLHEPPRRVLVELPDSKVTLSDYLFPGERPKESMILFKELLDLEVEENQVQDVEQQVDLTRFYNQNEEKSHSIDSSKEFGANNLNIFYIVGGIIAIVIAVIGILIHFIYLRR